MDPFCHRPATLDDATALRALITGAVEALQHDFLSAEQVAASHAFMGLDTQLIIDGTYFVIEHDAVLAGCGGWSRRATLFGADHSVRTRDPTLLDPRRDSARIRAMFTARSYVRRGVGRLILSLCEAEARDEGFAHAELMATMAGEPLYRACGYVESERIVVTAGAITVPLVRMTKQLA